MFSMHLTAKFIIVSFHSGFVYTKKSNCLYGWSVCLAFWHNGEEIIVSKPNDDAVYIYDLAHCLLG